MQVNSISSRQLSDLIAENAFSGHGFVPLVGSGISAASGILMGQDFGNFLAYSVYRVVAGEPRHNIARDGWPKYPRDEEVDTVKKWAHNEFKNLCSDHECKPILDSENLVRTIEFKDANNSTKRQLWSTHRPLIPDIIRSRDRTTWQAETQTRKFQERFRKRPDWGEDAETGAFSRTSNQFFIDRAVRSMHDWRSMLQFLSQVQVNTDEKVSLVGKVDSSIIDSFNVYITQDRQINLGHKMLAHLAGPLRIRTVLTTNFDNLIETAFHKLLRPLSVVSVSSHGALPNPKSVRSKDTIVKLHGELTDTRADFSLDNEPSSGDKKTFAQYVRGDFDTSTATEPIPNHLLVLGFSGRDVRIIQMLKYTLDTRPHAKVYWICHGKNEPRTIRELFGPEYKDRVILHQTERPDLLLYEIYQHVTLNLPSGGFSYEFTHKVPPEKVWNAEDAEHIVSRDLELGRAGQDDPGYGMPAAIALRKSKRRKISENVGAEILKSVTNPPEDDVVRVFAHPKVKPVAEVHSKWIEDKTTRRAIKLAQVELYTSSESASAMRYAFNGLISRKTHCLWLELQDYTSPEALLQDVLRIIALRVGSYQLEHVVLFPGRPNDKGKRKTDEETIRPDNEAELFEHLKRLLEFLDISLGKWALFFYGRSIPGAASGWQNLPWGKEQISNFQSYLALLGRLGFHTVYTPMTKERSETEAKKVAVNAADFLDHLGLTEDPKTFDSFTKSIQRAGEKRGEFTRLQAKCIQDQLSEETTVDLSKAPQLELYDNLQEAVVENWIRPRPGGMEVKEARRFADRYYKKLRFLYASTLFRQSRHTSAFFSDAVFPCPNKFNTAGLDNDWERSLNVNRWVAQLGSVDLFFYKPGGYSWKYRDMRIGLQNKIEAIPFANINRSILGKLYERVAGFDDSKKGKAKLDEQFKQIKPLSFAVQIRARAHYEIATWYWKAFNATGHYLPFIESLYHNFECLNYIEYARPISIPFDEAPMPPVEVVNYRTTLARACMLGMIKSLKTAKPWIKFWLAGVAGHSIFESKDHEKWFRKRIECLKKDSRVLDWIPELESAIRMLRSEMDAVQSSLKSEAGNYVPKPYDLEFVPDVRSDRFSQKYAEIKKTRLPDLVISSDDKVWKVSFDKGFRNWLCSKRYAGLFQRRVNVNRGGELVNNDSTEKTSDVYPLGEIFKAVNQFYKSKLNTRDCAKKLSRMKTAWVNGNLQAIEFECETCSTSQIVEGKACEQEPCKGKFKYSFDNSAALFAVELLSDFAYLLMKRAKMERSANSDAINLRRRWVQATMICSVALDLCKHLHPNYLSRERKQQIKLQTLYGLALAYLGRPMEANRRFNEASAILSKETRTPDEVETAIIRLRRAEATMLRSALIADIIDCLPAVTGDFDTRNLIKSLADKPDVISTTLKNGLTTWDSKSAKINVGDYLQKLEENLFEKRGYTIRLQERDQDMEKDVVYADPIVRQMISNWKDENSEKNAQKAYESLFVLLGRMHSAFLDDAWVYIESAERLLAGHSQSSLWWGRVAALKLHAYSLIRADAKYESLVFRRRLQHDTAILDLRNRIQLIAPTSDYSKIQCVQLTAKAMRAISEQNFITKTPYMISQWKTLVTLLHKSLFGILENFAESRSGELPLLLVCAWRHSFSTFRTCLEAVESKEIKSLDDWNEFDLISSEPVDLVLDKKTHNDPAMEKRINTMLDSIHPGFANKLKANKEREEVCEALAALALIEQKFEKWIRP